jgi:Leucine-rich repeat (LRR) protein
MDDPKTLRELVPDSEKRSEVVRKLESGSFTPGELKFLNRSSGSGIITSGDHALLASPEEFSNRTRDIDLLERDCRSICIYGEPHEFKYLNRFPDLEVLKIDGTLPNKHLGLLQELPQLKQLSLRVQSVDCQPFASLTHLEHLYLYQCSKMTRLTGIESLSNLRTLKISQHKSFESLAPLSFLKHLTCLSLSGIQKGLKIPSLNPLADLCSLREVALENIILEDGDLSPILDFPDLSKLSIRGWGDADWLTLSQIGLLIAAYPNITSLHSLFLYECSWSPCSICKRLKWQFVGKETRPFCPDCDSHKIDQLLHSMSRYILENWKKHGKTESLDSEENPTVLMQKLQSENTIPSIQARLDQKAKERNQWQGEMGSQLNASECQEIYDNGVDEKLNEAFVQWEQSMEDAAYAEKLKRYLPPSHTIHQLVKTYPSLDDVPRDIQALFVHGNEKGILKLPEFQNLEILSVYKLSARYAPVLLEMNNLKQLYIRDLQTTDLQCLANLENLTDLLLFQSGQVKSLKGIEWLSQLITLALDSHNELDTLQPLSHLSNLQGLRISRGLWKSVNIVSLGDLEKLQQLKYLSFNDVLVKDNQYLPLTRFKQLEEIEVGGNYSLEQLALMAAAYPQFPHLRKISLFANNYLPCKKGGLSKLVLIGKGSLGLNGPHPWAQTKFHGEGQSEFVQAKLLFLIFCRFWGVIWKEFSR